MPPRKRARISQVASPATRTKSPEPVPIPDKTTDVDILNDPWTDEEEIGLFKGLIKWKPTGVHKHYRMLQLREWLLENNYIHPRNRHTRLPGIWQKLASLYHLEALDEREDARQLSDISESNDQEEEEEVEDDVYSTAENKIHKATFDLPEDYSQLKWEKRLGDEKQRREESPSQLPELNMAEQVPTKFVATFSTEPEEALEETSTPATRRRGRISGKVTKAKPTPAPTTRRSRRQATATEDEEAESEVEDSEVADDSEDDEEDNQSVAEENGPAKRPRGRPRGSGVGRGTPRGRARGRQR